MKMKSKQHGLDGRARWGWGRHSTLTKNLRAFGALLAVAATFLRADELLLSEDFSSGYASTNFFFHYTNGVYFANGGLSCTGRCLVETWRYFEGDVRIEVEVAKEGTIPNGWYDIYLALNSLPTSNAIVRFDSGGVDGLALAYAHQNNDFFGMPAETPNQGRLSFFHQKGRIHAEYMAVNGEKIITPAYDVGVIQPFSIRILALGWPQSPRIIRNFRVYTLAPDPPDAGDVHLQINKVLGTNVASLTQLRRRPPDQGFKVAWVHDPALTNDFPAGRMFAWIETSTSPTNTTTVFQVDGVSTGRWVAVDSPVNGQ